MAERLNVWVRVFPNGIGGHTVQMHNFDGDAKQIRGDSLPQLIDDVTEWMYAIASGDSDHSG